jgi:hypothetical protein
MFLHRSFVNISRKSLTSRTVSNDLKDAAALTGKTDNSNAAPPTINVVDNEVDHELAKGL